MVSIKETSYKNFGKCLSISNEKLEILVTIDIGPRIIKCNLAGKENLMFNDIDRKVTQDVSSLYGEDKTWYIYGGHRIWLSPEKFPDTYYPDNEKVVYTTFNNGAIFTPIQQDKTGLQLQMMLEMDETEPKVTIEHKITNTLKQPIEGAVWCLSVMDAGGAVVVPQPTEDTGLLHNRTLALWPYTKMTDKRVFWGDSFIALRQDPTVENPIKFGINNTFHKAAYINHGQALVKDFDVDHPDGKYPDGGMSCEVYASALFTECESLSPLKTLKKGESITHTERWTVYDNIDIGEFSNDSLNKLSEIFS
ncbi:MAG: hypothetical protein J5832_06720 [Clostridia bacterium]|nr:hypothetical protein [Clostridia bacterium]